MKFDTLLYKEKNKVYEIYCFLSRKHAIVKSFDSVLLDLRKLVRDCKYVNLEESILRDQLILGVNDKRLSDRLLAERVEYTKAVEMCYTHEISTV